MSELEETMVAALKDYLEACAASGMSQAEIMGRAQGAFMRGLA